MNNLKFIKYANLHNLEVAFTRNSEIIIGFDDFAAAKKCADELNGIVCYFSRRDGSQYWSYENTADGPLEINDYWLTDDMELYRHDPNWFENYKDFFETVVTDMMENDFTYESLDILVGYIQEIKRFHEKMMALDENEQLLVYNGRLSSVEVVPINTMHYHDFDVKDSVVGVMAFGCHDTEEDEDDNK